MKKETSRKKLYNRSIDKFHELSRAPTIDFYETCKFEYFISCKQNVKDSIEI